MSASEDGRFEEVARKARRVQDAIDLVRGTTRVAGIRIEVAADGRITGLELADQALAQAIMFAHSQALDHAKEQVAEHQRLLADDNVVSSVIRKLVAEEQPEPSPTSRTYPLSSTGPLNGFHLSPPRKEPAEEPWDDPDYRNPFALPREIQRRYGL
ncbi:hypothetical protein ACFXHA_35225 [Nocardia sp. NPDC059240]|uniref:hypothetical protein n=1 Tax=Nocardia sp. NPDC059240 TaxID=3346786 RepID=UPI0036C95B26